MTHRMWSVYWKSNKPAKGTRYHCDCCSCIPTNTVMEATTGRSVPKRKGACRFGCEDISDAKVFVLMLADKWVWEFPGQSIFK